MPEICDDILLLPVGNYSLSPFPIHVAADNVTAPVTNRSIGFVVVVVVSLLLDIVCVCFSCFYLFIYFAMTP